MGECTFCDIATRDAHGRIVRESKHALAFLDVNPLAPGHTLVAPKDHYARLRDLPEDQAADLFGQVYALASDVEDAVGADGLSIGVNDGEAAGQEVTHLHVHLIPRFDGDGGDSIHAVAGERPDLTDEETDDIEARIEKGGE
jgi:histidine triad (HIT) family protein